MLVDLEEVKAIIQKHLDSITDDTARLEEQYKTDCKRNNIACAAVDASNISQCQAMFLSISQLYDAIIEELEK